MHYTNHDWRPPKKISTKYWKEIWDCSKNIWSIELLNSARNYLDYMIVGRFLGVAELGLYFFAFNAGLGISLSIVKGVNSALLPHLCESRSNWTMFKENYFSSIKTIALIIIPFVALQASLAPIYVPIVFGQKWIPAVPILILICLSAIPRPFGEAALQLLIAFGRADLGLRWNVFFTTIFIGCLLVGVHWQVFGVAMAVLLIHVVAIPIFVVLATRFVFKNMLASGA
jgi:PST family polysaccharide transporter